MVRHIVSWNFQPQLTEAEKDAARKALVEAAATLTKNLPVALKMEMITPPLGTSSCDVALYSEFKSEEDLAAYQIHPEHLKVVEIVKANLCDRRCVDVFG